MDTLSALYGKLLIEQFKFEAIKQPPHKQSNIDDLIKCIKKCEIITVEDKDFYRARDIDPNDPHIKYDSEGIPVRGYSSELSGVAPSQFISAGRANNSREQVLYVAEDHYTAMKEARAKKYASVASCRFKQGIQVFDFSPFSNVQLEEYRDRNLSNDLNSYLFVEMQRILTMPEYKENDYKISRDLVALMKTNWKNVSGIMYISSFTSKINLAIWDDNKNAKFTDGKIMKVA